MTTQNRESWLLNRKRFLLTIKARRALEARAVRVPIIVLATETTAPLMRLFLCMTVL